MRGGEKIMDNTLSTGQATSIRETITGDEFSKLNDALLRLEGNFNQLAKRLTPVLNNNPRPSEPQTEGKEASLPELPARIREAREKISVLGSQISEIIERLEI